MKIEQILRSAVLAGICIGIAGFGYLADEKGIVGAVLFAFGLLTVVSYSLKLYTGTAGFIKKGEIKYGSIKYPFHSYPFPLPLTFHRGRGRAGTERNGSENAERYRDLQGHHQGQYRV